MDAFNQATRKFALATTLVGKGNFAEAARIIRHKTWTDCQALGLRRDLSQPFTASAATVSITIRRLRENDISQLLDVETPDLSGAERHERMNRLSMLRAGFDRCYVAVTEEDQPCYIQWLIGCTENDRLHRYFGDLYPALAADEALLEGAYTPVAHRGKRIMPCAMAQIAEQASHLGARWVTTFVGQDNMPSLKGCKRAGFVPHVVRTETWRLFHQQVIFNLLPPGTPYEFEAAIATAEQAQLAASPS